MIQRVGFVIHREKPEAEKWAAVAGKAFSQCGVQTMILNGEERTDFNPDMIVTFGGDGTFLNGAHYAMDYCVPLLGINLGTVGFLTEEEPEKIPQAVEAILRNEYQLEERSLLQVDGFDAGFRQLALNDAVITRGGYARLIRVESFINDEMYSVFTADGIIVATPTGSTGYSLSAGGPLIEPDMNCMIITPVCPHSLYQRPCVVSGHSAIRLRLSEDRSQSAELQIDGKSRLKLRAGEEIMITGSEKTLKLVRLRQFEFFNILRKKLTEWGSQHG